VAQVLRRFLRENIGTGKVVRLLKTFVFEPEDVEAEFRGGRGEAEGVLAGEKTSAIRSERNTARVLGCFPFRNSRNLEIITGYDLRRRATD
jgi:hypothetical protein